MLCHSCRRMFSQSWLVNRFAKLVPSNSKCDSRRLLHRNSSQVQSSISSHINEDSWFHSGNGKLYKSHRPTTYLQKALLTVGSAFMSIYDPYRHDMIAVLGETTGYFALQRIHSQMKKHPEGQQILSERPRINTHTVDMDQLSELPHGTLGREYHNFMTKNRITSDSRAAVQYVDDGELAYVMQRYREVHDFYHCLLGMPTTMLGEVAVKWFETFNTRLPMCAMGALVGPIRLSAKRRKVLREHYIPLVIEMASKSELVLNCYFENRWEESIDEVRRNLGLEVIAKPATTR